jgi:hypothetical protein
MPLNAEQPRITNASSDKSDADLSAAAAKKLVRVQKLMEAGDDDGLLCPSRDQ